MQWHTSWVKYIAMFFLNKSDQALRLLSTNINPTNNDNEIGWNLVQVRKYTVLYYKKKGGLVSATQSEGPQKQVDFMK